MILEEAYPEVEAMPDALLSLATLCSAVSPNKHLTGFYFGRGMQKDAQLIKMDVFCYIIEKFYVRSDHKAQDSALVLVARRLNSLLSAEGYSKTGNFAELIEKSMLISQSKREAVLLLNTLSLVFHPLAWSDLASSALSAACKIMPSSRVSQLRLLASKLSGARKDRDNITSFLAAATLAVQHLGADIMVNQFLLTALSMSKEHDQVIEGVERLCKEGLSLSSLIPWKVNALLLKGDKEGARKLMQDGEDNMAKHSEHTREKEEEVNVLFTLERAYSFRLLGEHENVRKTLMTLVEEKLQKMTSAESDMISFFIATELPDAHNLLIWTLQRFTKHYRDDVDYLGGMARTEVLNRRPEVAMNIYRQIESIGHLTTYDIFQVSQIYAGWNETEKALSLVRLAQTRRSSGPRGERIFEALKNNDFASLYDPPRHPVPYAFAQSCEASLLLTMGRFDEAIQVFEKYKHDYGSYCPTACFNFGFLYAGVLDDVLNRPSTPEAASYVDDSRALPLLLHATQSHTYAGPSIHTIAHNLISKILANQGQSNESEFHRKKAADA